jgi:hypothetical protein
MVYSSFRAIIIISWILQQNWRMYWGIAIYMSTFPRIFPLKRPFGETKYANVTERKGHLTMKFFSPKLLFHKQWTHFAFSCIILFITNRMRSFETFKAMMFQVDLNQLFLLYNMVTWVDVVQTTSKHLSGVWWMAVRISEAKLKLYP